MMESRRAFLLSRSLSGFRNRTLKSYYLLTKGSNLRRNTIDQLSRAAVVEDSFYWIVFPVKVKISVLVGLQYFFTNSYRSSLRKAFRLVPDNGSYASVLATDSLSSKFFSSHYFSSPTSTNTHFEESLTLLIEWPQAYQRTIMSLSMRMGEPTSILSQVQRYISKSSCYGSACVFPLSSRTKGSFDMTLRKRAASLSGFLVIRLLRYASMRAGMVEKCMAIIIPPTKVQNQTHAYASNRQ